VLYVYVNDTGISTVSMHYIPISFMIGWRFLERDSCKSLSYTCLCEHSH